MRRLNLKDMMPVALRDRLPYYLLAIPLLYILIVPAFVLQQTADKDLNRLKARAKELTALSVEYKSIISRIKALESKKTVRKSGSVTQAVDDTLSSIGLKNKLKSLKMTGSKEIKGFTEEAADMILEKLTMNELLNMFYKIETGPALLSVTRVNIKKNFEAPELLNVSMTVSFFIEK